MKILVVDDEVVSRTKLKLIMDNFGECDAVDNGKDAVAKFHKAQEIGKPYGLILLDIDMPQKDGMQVLSELIETQTRLGISRSQKTKILMVTSFTDRDRVLGCIQSGCDDYIAKPFDIDTIGKKLSKLGIRPRWIQAGESAAKPSDDNSSSYFIDGIVNAFENKKINLPTLPRIQTKFRELLLTGADSQGIANLLKKDVAISAELIRMSNSAYYKGVIQNKSLEQAISRLGAAATEQTVAELTGHEFYTMKTRKYRTLIEKVWRHSIACAFASEITAKLLHLELAVDPFAMGLLHDIGKLALLEIMADMDRKGKFNGGIPGVQLIDTISAHHGVVGAKLLEKWKYADSYVASASDHKDSGAEADEEIKETVPKEILIVRFANIVAKSIGYSLEENDYTDLPIENIDLAYDLQLNYIDMTKLQETLTEEMKGVMELF
jgi:putative nucleotidyltransferase with HDIG domain